jgi:hypothetical protein
MRVSPIIHDPGYVANRKYVTPMREEDDNKIRASSSSADDYDIRLLVNNQILFLLECE